MNIFDLSKDVIVGISAGYDYSKNKIKEEEVKQGKNYYLTAPFIIGQLSDLSLLISSVSNAIPNLTKPAKFAISACCNIAPLAGGLVFYPLCAAVKHGDYELLAGLLSERARIPLPEKLGGRSVAVLSFFAEHTGNLIEVAILVSSTALIALGFPVLGGSVLAAIGYEILDKHGYVPFRISLFMETYMPIISTLGMIVGGTPINRLVSMTKLGCTASYSVSCLFQRVLDDLMRYGLMKASGVNLSLYLPSVSEADAPFVRPSEMTYEQINEVLNLNDVDFDYQNLQKKYKINPAHCSRWAIDLDKFPLDRDFKKFRILFKSINWEKNINLIIGKLKDDDRFIDFLFSNCDLIENKEFTKQGVEEEGLEEVFHLEEGVGQDKPLAIKKEIANNILAYIEQVAQKKKISSEKFIVDWIDEQITELTEVLQGEKRVKGSQQDLSEAIDACTLILPYLSSLDEGDIEREDILIKLAIEGGGYCARGIKRAANELVWDIIQRVEPANQDANDPLKRYEDKLFHALQSSRGRILQGAYENLTKSLPKAVAGDVHGYDIYRQSLAIGFYPLTRFERKRMSINEILNKYAFGGSSMRMYQSYLNELGNVINEVGNQAFSDYTIGSINQNTLLSPEQKEHLINDKWGDWASDEKDADGNFVIDEFGQLKRWTPEEVERKFQRLALIQLGVLIPA